MPPGHFFLRFFAVSSTIHNTGRKGIVRHVTNTNSLNAKSSLLNTVLNGDYQHNHGNLYNAVARVFTHGTCCTHVLSEIKDYCQ